MRFLAREGDIIKLKTALQTISYPADDPRNIIFRAALRFNHPEIAQYLIRSGADLVTSSPRPLYVAAEHTSLAVVREILDTCDHERIMRHLPMGFYCACNRGHLEMAQFFHNRMTGRDRHRPKLNCRWPENKTNHQLTQFMLNIGYTFDPPLGQDFYKAREDGLIVAQELEPRINRDTTGIIIEYLNLCLE